MVRWVGLGILYLLLIVTVAMVVIHRVWPGLPLVVMACIVVYQVAAWGWRRRGQKN